MHGAKSVAILLIFSLSAAAATAQFSGVEALEYARKIVSFGPRPPGSDAIHKLQTWIVAQLKTCRCEVTQDDFTAYTPLGATKMKNLIARFPGRSGRAVVFSGHYDTKVLPGIHFVGANDGGSSAAFLLEMAKALQGRPPKDDVYLVWFDGEEAIAQWSETDGLYGSRHLADKWASDGTLAKIRALINVDMIGNRKLGLLQETNSSETLRKLVWDTAARLGYGSHFLNRQTATVDDHAPFLRRGVNALDLIVEFGPPNAAWWHTDEDTVDKLSANSFTVIGRVLLAALAELEK